MLGNNDVVLITGGGSGVGKELALRLAGRGCKVLICGRTQSKLERVADLDASIRAFACNVATAEGRSELVGWAGSQFGGLNVLVNNAGVVRASSTLQKNLQEEAAQEVATNFLGPVLLSQLAAPIMAGRPRARVVNVSSGLAFVPRTRYPIYCATKAALHSFTLCQRDELRAHGIDVTEVFLPAVDTPWHRGAPPKIAISASEAAAQMLVGIDEGRSEVIVGKARQLRLLSRLSPSLAYKLVNKL